MVEAPLEISLEFARSESTGDPHTFRFGPQSYVVRTPRGGFGGAELPWDTELLGQLAAVRLPGRDPQVLAAVGEKLRRFLAPAGWELHEQQLTTAVQQRRPVHVTIRSAAAELYVLPWELLTLRATGQSLGGLPGVLVRYEWPETVTTPQPAEPPAKGRLLVAWSAAGGAVPAADHVAAIRSAATAGGHPFTDDDILTHASPGRLAAALDAAERAGKPYAALHLLCHGGTQGATYGLVLDGEAADDPSVLLDAARLQQLVAPHAGALRLVVLAACDSGNQGEPGGLLGSAAQMLHRAGVAAVVASRYPLSVAGSKQLTAALYRGLLAEHAALERAFVAARTALAGDATSLDWASVQLYARAADGFAAHPLGGAPRLDVAPTPTPTKPRAPLPWLAAGGLAVLAVIGGLWATRTPTTVEPPPQPEPKPEAERAEPTPPPEPRPTPPTPPPVEPVPKDTKVDPPPEPKPDPEPTKQPKIKPPVDKPSVECPSALKSYVRSMLPQGAGPVTRLVIKVDAKGNLTTTAAAARSALADKGSPDKAKKYAGDALPCHFSYEWAP